MRITKSMQSMLAEMFRKKMLALLADDDRPVSTWTEYLEGIGCRRVGDAKPQKGFVVVEDPVWHNNKIRVPKDTAVMALVLEWLP